MYDPSECLYPPCVCPHWYVVHVYVALCVGCSLYMFISEPIQILHVVSKKKNGNHRAKGYLLVTIEEAIDRQASAEQAFLGDWKLSGHRSFLKKTGL